MSVVARHVANDSEAALVELDADGVSLALSIDNGLTWRDVDAPAVGAPLEEWDQMVKLNVQGVLYITHAALPHLIAAAQDSARQVADLSRNLGLGTCCGKCLPQARASLADSLRQHEARASGCFPGTITEFAL